MTTSAAGMPVQHLLDLYGRGTLIGFTDGQLLARYAALNDGLAFESLVARHGPMVVATCRAILEHEHDVEDAFQATFLVLARKARSVRAPAPWAAGCTAWPIASRSRQRGKRPKDNNSSRR